MCVEQNAVGTPFGRWDANTWAGSLRLCGLPLCQQQY